MDAFEQMALDLEVAQEKRNKRFKYKDRFWTPEEKEIWDTIKLFRDSSRTFDPAIHKDESR
jgi:hypothetical protein